MAIRRILSNRTRIVQVPSVPGLQDSNLRSFLEAMKQAIEVGEGVRGDPLDTKLTKRDLVEAGIITPAGERVSDSEASAPPPSEGTGDGLPVADAPPILRNFRASGLFSRVLLEWDLPAYSNHDRVEIYRADVEDFGQAVPIGSSTGVMYVDVVGGGWSGYYWAASFSREGRKGPVAGPAYAETPQDPEYVIDLLEGRLDENALVTNLRTKIEDGGTYEQTFDEITNQWTVKINNDGRVAGVGLMLEDDEPSTFAVIADQFAIAPEDPNEEATAPFFHLTVPQVIDGVEIPAGTYMRNAFIADATLTTAKIENGFLDNLTAEKGTLAAARIQQGAFDQAWFSGDLQSGYVDTTEDPWKWVPTFSPGSSGWIIRNNGTAEFNNAVFRGVVEVTGGSVPYGYVSGDKPPVDAEPTTIQIGNQPAQDAIIVLCRRGSGNNNFVLGAITGKRVSGNTDAAKVDVVVNHDSSGVPSGNINVMGIQGHPDEFSLVTFTYNGVTWVGLRHHPNSQYRIWSNGTYFVGQTASSSAAMFWVATSSVSSLSDLTSKHAPYGSIEQWRRRGHTTIDGDKIFTGSAYVNTLQIKDGAVSATETFRSARVALTPRGVEGWAGSSGGQPVPEEDGWQWLGSKGIWVPHEAPPGTVVLVSAQMEVQNAAQSVDTSHAGFQRYVMQVMRNSPSGGSTGTRPHGASLLSDLLGGFSESPNTPGMFGLACTFRATGVADQVWWNISWGDAIQGLTLLAFFPVVPGRTYSARFRSWNGTNHQGSGWVQTYLHLAMR